MNNSFQLSGKESMSSTSSLSSYGSFSPDRSKPAQCPFGLDENNNSSSSVGYRNGGPKESRLRRSAIISSQKPIEHLHPIKVRNLPRNSSEEKLQNFFERFGEVGDVYIPRKLGKTLEPAKDFAIVRFLNKSSSSKALEELNSSLKDRTLGNKDMEVKEPEKQIVFFSNNTGALGICNIPTENNLNKSKFISQDISLNECLSRSGYPWGSKRELRILEPHVPKDALNLHGIKILNLSTLSTLEEVREIFIRYGDIACVFFPKPLQIALRPKDPNMGYGFVRFHDKRDVDKALNDIHNGLVEISGQKIEGEYVPPQYWPSDKTRRFY